MNSDEAARLLGVANVHTIHEYIRYGALKATLGSSRGIRHWNIDEESVRQLQKIGPRHRKSHRYIEKEDNMHRDEKPLGDGIIKVWRDDSKEISIHHRAGLTIALNDLEEIELFQWLANDLEKRGLLPTLPE